MLVQSSNTNMQLCIFQDVYYLNTTNIYVNTQYKVANSMIVLNYK